MRNYLSVGLVGLEVQILANLIAMLSLKGPAAEFLSEQWWSSWFPTYVTFCGFVLIGLVATVKATPTENNDTTPADAALSR